MLFMGKIPFHVAAILTTPFATICHYSRLFAIFPTIRDYSQYLHYSLLRYTGLIAVRYLQLLAIRYSGFPDTQTKETLRSSLNFSIGKFTPKFKSCCQSEVRQ